MSTRKPVEFVAHPAAYMGRTFRAFCRHVVDGDTIDVLVDLGFYCYSYVTLRIADLDAPELYGSASAAEKERARAAKALVERLVLNQPVLLTMSAKDTTTFGRFETHVFYFDAEGVSRSVADALRAASLTS